MLFEWDRKKDQQNKKNHGVSFEEAAEVFDDPLCVSFLDKRFDYFEERYISIGHSKSGKLLIVAHLYYPGDQGDEITRMISARKTTKKERKEYEKRTAERT
ncbi:MAG: BrnT family toxin [Nitrospirae bacterium]|nr:BrnT family toxin [Nitrospirota bacterium]